MDRLLHGLSVSVFVQPSRMRWGKIYRRMKVFAVALVIYLEYKVMEKAEKWIRKSRRDAIWEIVHQRNAKRVLNMVIELEGLWVKLGQYLSTRADVLPEAYTSLLRQLQDSLPQRPLDEVIHTIEKELGKPMENLFIDFNETPLATASIAEVHQAVLRDGRQVVVKVQHEGINELILEDLKNAKTITDWIAWAEPQYDFNCLIDEWCKEAPKELDFNHEAENTRRVSKNLGCSGGSTSSKQCCRSIYTNSVERPNVLIPEVIQSSGRVLVLEYMDGVRLSDHKSLEAIGVEKQKIVEEITHAYAHQIYIDGFFNGDPHPGNFLVSRKPPHYPILLDFGLTKSLSYSMKQALAKMFLASVEGDHVALLSSFAEMGLRLRVDMPEQAMEAANIFFQSSTPRDEYVENMQSAAKDRVEKMKAFQEKINTSGKGNKYLNPVEAFPSDAVIFVRVLNLLRGLSSMMNVKTSYLEIMRPYAESTLLGNKIYAAIGPATCSNWIHGTPIVSPVEEKLRKLLIELGSQNILGIQVCAYKDGKVLVDTAAGVLGKFDPRPVQPDSLFPIFSATKGITAGMIHWLVDSRKLKFEESVSNVWPSFLSHGKDAIKVHHVLNHTSGLPNAMMDIVKEDPMVICDWSKSLQLIAASVPETLPGLKQEYHYLSFGWLCGGIIEHASGKSFQEALDEAIVKPLKVDNELYIGIPPGVESRLATVTIDTAYFEGMRRTDGNHGSSVTSHNMDVLSLVRTIPTIFNMLPVRRAVIPSANCHCSARALARYYAALAAGGDIPPPHNSVDPVLERNFDIPEFPTMEPVKKTQLNPMKMTRKEPIVCKSNSKLVQEHQAIFETNYGHNGIPEDRKMFSNAGVRDAFLGVGNYYGDMVVKDGHFGLGFKRLYAKEGLFSFGHSGMGGSTGFCDVENNFAMAVTVNRLSLGGVTKKIVQLICSELQIPLPEEFSSDGHLGLDMELNFRNYDMGAP